jgi:cobyric acid synthase
MKWLKESGMETAILKYAAKGNPVIGICGGYQMMGQKIADPNGVEGGGEIAGLGLLPLETILEERKHRRQVQGKIQDATGRFAELKGLEYTGYEIHMGSTRLVEAPVTGSMVTGSMGNTEDTDSSAIVEFTEGQTGYASGNLYGTYIHGFFDRREIVETLIQKIVEAKGIFFAMNQVMDYQELKEQEYDLLANTMREFMDMKKIYEMMGLHHDRNEV